MPSTQLVEKAREAPAPNGPVRLAYLVTHPIQYQAPMLAAIARDPGIELRVFFCTDLSASAFRDPEFATTVEWQPDLLDGYRHDVLPAVFGADRIGAWTPVNHGLAPRLRDGRFDAMLVHGFGRPFNLMAMLTAKRLGLTVLVRDEATAVSRRRGIAKRWIKRRLFRALDRVVDRWMAIGSLNRAYYLQLGIDAERIGWMPYGVDNRAFAARAPAPEVARRTLAARFQLDPGRPVLLFAGKLIARKRPELIIQAIDRLTPSTRPALLFAGDGPLANTLTADAAARGVAARVTGFVPQQELPLFYAGADLMVLPSEAESWGLVVNEAMACGLPVVASDRVGAAADLVVEGETGWTFASGDADALARRIAAATADRARLAAMRQTARATVAAFDVDAAVAGLRAALGPRSRS